MYYITKRGGSPYNGPTLQRAGIIGKFYYSREEAEKDAKILTYYNPAGFDVESIEEEHPGFESGVYPLLRKIEQTQGVEENV
jgi:hypothetical protein